MIIFSEHTGQAWRKGRLRGCTAGMQHLDAYRQKDDAATHPECHLPNSKPHP
jgi:hypothetical protein